MSIKDNLEKVKQKIAETAIRVGKNAEDITLVMATKTGSD
jgi:PLP dependent protein